MIQFGLKRKAGNKTCERNDTKANDYRFLGDVKLGFYKLSREWALMSQRGFVELYRNSAS